MTKRLLLAAMIATCVGGTLLAQGGAGLQPIGCVVIKDATGSTIGNMFDNGNEVLMESSLVPGRVVALRTSIPSPSFGLQGNSTVYFDGPGCTGNAFMFDNGSAGIVRPFTDQNTLTLYAPDITATPLSPVVVSRIFRNGNTFVQCSVFGPTTFAAPIFPVITASYNGLTEFPPPYTAVAGSCEPGGGNGGGIPDHTHNYLTGRGSGHNNTDATTGPPVATAP